MKNKVLAGKIAKSLFNIAKENDALLVVENDLTESSKSILNEQSFITLMNNPNILIEKKCQIIDAAFKGVNPYVVNVIKILANNLHVNLIDEVREDFQKLNNKFNKTQLVKVESVYKLTDEELEKVANAIKSKIKVDNVEIENVLDETLIGGLRISYDGKVIDSTIKARIQEMKNKLSTI
ncbi:ATP synthase F1 subunit delta [Gemella sp. 19428wG2_WT2a]|nr:ATP synthase F1 subunit delta [Gemella sp. 19428wG2_WT2a]TFU59155.1 ATP synthase F1 subunit delta [Gemella sp. WT2a]